MCLNWAEAPGALRRAESTYNPKSGSVATKRTKRTILHLVALGLAAVVLNPRLWMIASSCKPARDLRRDHVASSINLSFDNFVPRYGISGFSTLPFNSSRPGRTRQIRSRLDARTVSARGCWQDRHLPRSAAPNHGREVPRLPVHPVFAARAGLAGAVRCGSGRMSCTPCRTSSWASASVGAASVMSPSTSPRSQTR